MNHDQGTFQSVAFLEPFFESTRQGTRIMRSLAEVRRIKCRPKHPLVVGFLDDPLFKMRSPVRSALATRRNRPLAVTTTPGKPLIFLLGHWD